MRDAASAGRVFVKKQKIMLAVVAGVTLLGCSIIGIRWISMARVEPTFAAYVKYFRSAYDIIDKNYYMPVDQKVFDDYIVDFRTRIFEKQLKDKTHLIASVKHVGTGILVARLKDPSDPFSNFFPPQMVKAFKESVLGYGGDIGIEGAFKNGRYVISQVEPRSDAFRKGVMISDEIVTVEGKPVTELSEDALKKIFAPAQAKEVILGIFSPKRGGTYTVKVASTTYFKQSIFPVATKDPAVACLGIRFFNEETGNDLRVFADALNKSSISKLIIDLRDNGGGPPLAAWEIAGIFLDPEQKLFYYLRRNGAPSGLITPASPVRYKGEVLIITNKGTGSAAEIFAGYMQAYRRAAIIGGNSAGKVYLKSLFDLDDGATIELTVAKGYLYNGNPIDKNGLVPDVTVGADRDVFDAAVDLIARTPAP